MAAAVAIAPLGATAQIFDLDRGLSPVSVGTIDFGGFIPWSTVESPTGKERNVLNLLAKGEYSSAEKQARLCVEGGPGRLIAHSLLLQATIGQRTRKKLDDLVDSYRRRSDRSKNTVEQIAYARALAVQAGNLPASTPADWQRVEGALARATSRLAPADVGGSIVLADAWSSGANARFSKAREIMEAAVKASPSSIPARYFLLLQYDKGVLATNDPNVKVQKSRPVLVVREAETILKINPRFRQAYYFGGLARLKTGDRAGAADWLRRYRELNPYKKGEPFETAGKIIKAIEGV